MLLPPLKNFWREKIPFLSNKIAKGGLLVVLFFVGALSNPNISKNSTEKTVVKGEMSFDKKRDLLIDYIKNNKTTDKSLVNISKLGEIGEMFGNGNYSINNPHDGYNFGIFRQFNKT